ncbi:class I SAM-dependent methyltransferase [Crocosphaera sp. UHCC 0190]|uniref:class I SAM-dependent methyltransferase n=1 Tax=Crocosphaera sp. UHCC 0190 TaxID=3110246 RepID=UPI002B210558|nr:class I SAM-dependent methyltransferase [Crocosphaera sp. UHCC 0190]MEA5511159.1 class I SAM-dependent methyltransferase [Crocosphaera sp. UHCC 0190]
MSQQETYKVWEKAELSKSFLEGVRGAIPLAAEQIEIILRLINLTQSQVDKFLDLGCGNGILGKAIYSDFPQAKGCFLDLSEPMIKAAKNNLSEQQESTFIIADFGQKDWINLIDKTVKFDVIVSGFAIHHLPDNRKREIYEEIYQLLKPGGLFLNLEHVSSVSPLGEKAFNDLFVDSLYAFHQQQGSQNSPQEIEAEYYNRPDKSANILTLVETQCQWLREIGFVEVDCFMKIFEIALFGGIRPH